MDGGAALAGLLGARRGGPGRGPGQPARSPSSGIATSSRSSSTTAPTAGSPRSSPSVRWRSGSACSFGLLTGFAAFFGALMNMSFLLAGSASVNPVLFTLAIGLILAWKVAGYYGVDRYLLPMLGTPWRPGAVTGRETSPARTPAELTAARSPARAERSPPPVRRTTTRGAVRALRRDPSSAGRRRPGPASPRRPRSARRRSAGDSGRGSSGARSHRADGGGRRTAPAGGAATGSNAASAPAVVQSARKSSRQNGGLAEGVGPGGVARPLGEPRERRLDRGRALRAGDARWALAGDAESGAEASTPATRSAARGRRGAGRSRADRSIDEPRMPPVSRRSVGTSSATWRRQNPCTRSSSARNPMSSTCSLMIESSVARSERARTAQTGQPPSAHRLEQPHVDDVARRPGRRDRRLLTIRHRSATGCPRSPPDPRRGPGHRRARPGTRPPRAVAVRCARRSAPSSGSNGSRSATRDLRCEVDVARSHPLDMRREEAARQAPAPPGRGDARARAGRPVPPRPRAVTARRPRRSCRRPRP